MEVIISGITSVLTPYSIVLMFFGTALGIIFGALPGLSATMGIALCLPMTYTMNSAQAIALLIGIYIGGISGGLVSAILINVPGTSSSIATCFDGNPMAERGESGRALCVGLTSSFIGTLLSFLVLITVAPKLAQFTLKFSPYDYFAVCLFSLTLIGTLISGSVIKGLISGLIGILLGCVGVAPITGTIRYTLGFRQLRGGLSSTAAMVGIFAVGAIMSSIVKGFDSGTKPVRQYKMRGTGFTRKEFRGQIPNFLRSALIGIGIGILPGIGGGTSNLIAYGVAKSSSKYPEKFGTGIIDGIVASETSNNASIGGALVPLLTIGIPGDTCTAMLLGALTIQGLTPGPLLFNTDGKFVYGLFGAVFFCTLIMIFLEYFGMSAIVKILDIPRWILLPCIMMVCMVGVFSSNNRVFDLWTMLFFGAIGFLFSLFGFPTAPIILGFIIGPYMEEYLLRSISLGRGSLAGIFQKPIAMFFLIVALVFVSYTVYKNIKHGKLAADVDED